MANNLLDTPIEYLKGVGPERAKLLKQEFDIHSFGDLLRWYPYRYVDRTRFYKTNEISGDLLYVQLRGQIRSLKSSGHSKGARMTAQFVDDAGSVELIWFAGLKWLQGKYKPGQEYVVFGKPTVYNGKINIAHPETEEITVENLKRTSALQPMYSSSERSKMKGLDSKGIMKLQKTISLLVESKIPETLPEKIIENLKLLSREETLKQIHFPSNPQIVLRAEARIKFEEFLYIQLRILRVKMMRQENVKGWVFDTVGEQFNSFFNNHLPFPLTNAQKRVIKEIRQDLGGGKQMNRLLQGDVGSGKTVVALMCMLLANDNGFQACLMAPTEILANQHFVTLKELLKNMSIHIGLLTGSTKTKDRKVLHEALRSGEMNILIGTHALIEDVVQFKNLGLVVIDEQHRFGVEQRSKLWKKNTNPPHILVMTATPIPRTLAMTLYGDLDTSIIDEMPPGRKQIRTVHYFDSQRLRVFGFMKEQIQAGRQIYLVYPLIDESKTMDYKNLMDGYESISRAFPLPEFNVSIVHGQMKAADKNFEMERFVKGETNIMVATTVIEVGVNIPNASVMIVESAERFGLSQLHQLRGRVGRGAEQSFCILMTSYKLGKDSKLRMDTMVRTNDGFEIAEVDLKLRGPGDLEGTQQSGLIGLRLADITKDGAILQHARGVAAEILDDDPTLEKPIHAALLNEMKREQKSSVNWGRIS
ncbi:MAG: ATP-dependent DNA helicase RecG [Flavobacteriales bacterium]|nr:MAG: ATP-dependent DNA helicase RecG [Flavobacteriales bacterium]